MPLKINIPKFTSKDFTVLVASMLPMALLYNSILFGKRYIQDGKVFFWSTLVTFGLLAVTFFCYGLIAISLRNRFPKDYEAPKRLTICITIFILSTAVIVSLMFRGYDLFGFFGYQYNDGDFTKGYLTMVVMNVFLTFLNEGISRFENYKETFKETEQLKKEYMHSQLLGLKSQMNPHFLFNSLNTLSCLISEDAEMAEDFLNHMSKVYRYLLRNNEEKLVTLETELSFIHSYYFLLKARYAEALKLSIGVNDEYKEKLIPPLTLQMIVENALNQNTVSKDKPLHIEIGISNDEIIVRNSVHAKINLIGNYAESLENIANKFRLLCQKEIMIRDMGAERIIQLPLLSNQEISLA